MSAKKNKYQSSSSVKPWVRILACFLAVLMVLGAITYTIFYLFAIDLYAASAKEYSYVDSTPDSDILVRVGLMYGMSLSAFKQLLRTDFLSEQLFGKITMKSFSEYHKHRYRPFTTEISAKPV